MTIVQKVFGFQGRLRRRDFWLINIGLCIVSWVASSILTAMFAPTLIASGGDEAIQLTALSGLGFGFWILCLLLLWPSLAVGVKRCHDRGKSGWWILLIFIPIIGFFWWLIDLGILDGTPGPNQYGMSPKTPLPVV